MSYSPLEIVSTALDAYVDRNTRPPAEQVSSDPIEIDIAMCCVVLGDVSALGRWINHLEDAIKVSSSAESEQLVTALKYLYSRWNEFESKAGNGALLDYRHCLQGSPAKVIGQDRIDNAQRFQITRLRPY